PRPSQSPRRRSILRRRGRGCPAQQAMPPRDDDPSSTQGNRDLLRLERDLYRRLLELGTQTRLEPLLREALALVVGAVGARYGYLERFGDHGPDGQPQWWMAHDMTPEAIEGVRRTISRGIIGAAIAGGETVMTTSAMLDPRFRQRASVAAANIEGVLCVPIGR